MCVFRNFGVAVTPPQFCKSDPKNLDLGSSSGTLDHGTSVSARWGESILGWSTGKEAAAATEAACHVPANWSALLLVPKQWRLANGHMRLLFGYGILWVNVSFFSNLHRFSSSTSRATESYDDVHVYSHMIKGQVHAIAVRCAKHTQLPNEAKALMKRLWLQIVGLVGVRVYNLGAILRSLRRAIQVSMHGWIGRPLSNHPILFFVWILHNLCSSPASTWPVERNSDLIHGAQQLEIYFRVWGGLDLWTRLFVWRWDLLLHTSAQLLWRHVQLRVPTKTAAQVRTTRATMRRLLHRVLLPPMLSSSADQRA